MIFVGGVTREKGVEELYRVATVFPDLTFELVGVIGEEARAWETPENVILRGGMSHDKVIECLDRADVFFFPSHTEGFSLALTEAMARGLPCIATDVGANENMLSGGCGIVVKKGDVEGMIAALESLRDENLRSSFSRQARRRVMNEYIPDMVLERLLSVYLR